MERLAHGKKPDVRQRKIYNTIQVDKKEMKRLTQKNFEKLPEVKSKKEEEKRLNELKARKAQAALYAKELDNRRRALVKQKKTSNQGLENLQLTTQDIE